MARYRIVELAINPSSPCYTVEKHQWLWKWKFEELFCELDKAEAFILSRIKPERVSTSKVKRRVVREYSSDCPFPGPPPLKLKQSVTWREGAVQRGNSEGGPTTLKPEIAPKGQSSLQAFRKP
jgi:hypothetical protein